MEGSEKISKAINNMIGFEGIQEQSENINMINKRFLRSLRTHTRKGNINCVETIQEIINKNTNQIIELMKKA